MSKFMNRRRAGNVNSEAGAGRPVIPLTRFKSKALNRRAAHVRNHVKLEDVVELYWRLRKDGNRRLGRCPFCNRASFAVYPALNGFVCDACDARGDVVMFVMNKESLTAEHALDALERFQVTGELYGTS